MTTNNPMNETPACTRHHRRVWIASCDECTAWHMAELHVGHDVPRSRRGGNTAAA